MMNILTKKQISALIGALENKIFSVSCGMGVDTAGMLVALHVAGLRPNALHFADVGGEKPETLIHLARMNKVMANWGWPQIEVCKKKTLPSTQYDDLYGNCVVNSCLPSLAYGMKGCSIKWKHVVQDQFIKGVKSGPSQRPPHQIWLDAKAKNQRIIRCIGYDSGKADIRRSSKPIPADADFDYIYPLQVIGWARPDCVDAITRYLGEDMVPIKSACYFCPASKVWELFWLAAHHPDLLEKALFMEWKAMTGHHSRFDEAGLGQSWEYFVMNEDKFPKTTATLGLGRSFSWNQWARVNGVVHANFIVKRNQVDIDRFIAMSKMLQKSDNALDNRSCGETPITFHKKDAGHLPVFAS